MAPAAPKESEFSVDKNKVMDQIEHFVLKYGSEHQEYLKALLLNFIKLTKIRPIDPAKIHAEKVDHIVRFQDAASDLQFPLLFRPAPIRHDANGHHMGNLSSSPPNIFELYRAWNGYIFVDTDHVTVKVPYWEGKEYDAVVKVVKKRIDVKEESEKNDGKGEGNIISVFVPKGRQETPREEFERLKRQIESASGESLRVTTRPPPSENTTVAVTIENAKATLVPKKKKKKTKKKKDQTRARRSNPPSPEPLIFSLR